MQFEIHVAKVRGSTLDRDGLSRSYPLRRDYRQQMQMAVLLFTNQHIAQSNSELCRKPSVWGKVLGKVACTPRQDAKFKASMRRAGMQQQCVEFLHGELLIAANDLCLRVLYGEVMVKPASVTIGHDAFLILGARCI